MTTRAVTVGYGPGRSQQCDLYLPAGADRVPVVIVVHGGYWRSRYGRELGTPLAQDLSSRGVAAWNIEYRRVGTGNAGGGGWPQTFLDVAAAVDALTTAPGADRLDLGRVSVVGHSAGGQLALWIAARPKLAQGAPGAGPRVVVRGVVSQAGVNDLVRGYQAQLSNGAVADLLGGTPLEVADRYALASPYELLPLGVPVTLVHGTDDEAVPIEQSERYAEAARAAGDDVTFVRLPGVDHFAVIDPATAAWAICRDAALGYLGVSAG